MSAIGMLFVVFFGMSTELEAEATEAIPSPTTSNYPSAFDHHVDAVSQGQT